MTNTTRVDATSKETNSALVNMEINGKDSKAHAMSRSEVLLPFPASSFYSFAFQ